MSHHVNSCRTQSNLQSEVHLIGLYIQREYQLFISKQNQIIINNSELGHQVFFPDPSAEISSNFDRKVAMMRGILAAKKILTSKPASTPKGFLAVYVGENQKKRYMVPVTFLNQTSFQALLSKAEEEFGFDHPMTIPCTEDTFVAVASQLR